MFIPIQPEFTGSMSAFPWSADLESKYSFTSRYGDFVNMSVRQGDTLYVPRETCPVGKIDRRMTHPTIAINCKPLVPRNDEQAPLINASLALLQQGTNHIFEAPTGWGKCQKKGSTVLMFDGTLKKVEDVKVGDLLMGPDSKHRTVLSLGSGIDPMVKITPIKGDPFYVNEDHVLSLKCTGGSTYAEDGTVVNVSVKEYLKWSKYKKHCFKLWRPDGLEFYGVESPLPVHPYALGLLLGDGGISTDSVMFFNEDKEVLSWLSTYCRENGLWLLKRPQKFTYCITRWAETSGPNWLIARLRDLDLMGADSGTKFIPQQYLTSSKHERLELLAGLLDTDGTLHGGATYDMTLKSERLVQQIVFLCRSLGLAAYYSECKKTCTNNGVTGTYYRVKITGHVDAINCRVLRKQAQPRQQKKDVLRLGFKIESAVSGEYYGFTLDGDHLYLMGDFVVTHNTVAGTYIAARLGQPTLIVVTQDNLMKAWRDTLINVLGIPREKIGKVQQNECTYEGKWFVIGMVHSLVIPDRYPSDLYRSFGLMILDEVHMMATEHFQQVCWKVSARYRLGMSATPDRKDGLTRILEAHIGKTLVKGTMVPMAPKVLVKRTGWRIPVKKTWVNDHYEDKKIPHSPGRMMLVFKAMANSNQRNALIVEFVQAAYAAGRTTLVMGDLTEHLQATFHACAEAGIPGNEMAYYMGTMTEAEYEHAKKSRVVHATYKKCATGTNVPHWDSMVLISPHADVEQAIGRVLRFVDGKKQPVILDMVDGDKLFETFHRARLRNYAKVGAVVYDV